MGLHCFILSRHQLINVPVNRLNTFSPKGNIRGLAAIPNREEEFKQSLEISIKYAKALECPRYFENVHVFKALNSIYFLI